MDEGTQVSARNNSGRKDSGNATDWLHSVTRPLAEFAEVIDVELSASSSRSLPVAVDSGSQLMASASGSRVPASAGSAKVIRHIEDLEKDIDKFLQAARFRNSEPEAKVPFQLCSRSESVLSTASSSAREIRTKKRMDSTTSTQYRQLPDHLAEFIRLTNPEEPEIRKKTSAGLKYLFRNQASGASGGEPPDTGLSSIFQLPRKPEASELIRKENTSGGSEEPQTYFRDFNEILKMDPNPFPIPAGNCNKVARTRGSIPEASSAPFNILSAISSNASGQPDAVDQSTILSKNGSESRSVHDGASSISSAPEVIGQAEAGIPEFHPDTTAYMTLTPHYTSSDSTQSEIPENPQQPEFQNSGISLSPIPRLSPPTEHPHSGSEESGIRKQSTSASEYDRSIEEVTLDEIRIPVERDMGERIRKPEDRIRKPEKNRNRKREALLLQLKSELIRDDSLFRSIQRVDNIHRMESSTPALPARKFRIQLDAQMRSLLESQTTALQSIVQNMEGIRIPEAGSRAAIEVDRIRSQLTTESAQHYTSDFDPTSASASRNEYESISRSIHPSTNPSIHLSIY